MKSVLTGVLNRLLLLFVDEVRFGFEVHLGQISLVAREFFLAYSIVRVTPQSTRFATHNKSAVLKNN